MPAYEGQEFIPFELSDFSGGYDGATSSLHLKPNQMRGGLNCWLNVFGALDSLMGYQKDVAADFGTNCRGAYDGARFYWNGNAITVVAVDGVPNAQIFKLVGSAWVEITGGTALTVGRKVRLLTYRGILFIYNGVQFQYWTGTGNKADVVFSSAGQTVIPKLMAEHGNRLWLVPANDVNTVYYTEDSPDPAAFLITVASSTTTDALIPIPNQGADMSGIVNLTYNQITLKFTLWRENDSYTLYGTDESDFMLVKDTTGSGTVSDRSVAMDGDGNTYSVGNGDFYKNGQSIGLPVTNQIASWNMREVVTAYSPLYKVVIFGFEEGTLFWNCRLSCWVPPTNIPMQSICWYPAASDGNKVVFTLPGQPYLYELFQTDKFDGDLIPFIYASPTLVVTRWTDTKVFKDIAVLIEAENPDDPTDYDACTVEVMVDKLLVLPSEIKFLPLGAVYGVGEYGTAKYDMGSVQVCFGEGGLQEAVGRTIDIMITRTKPGRFRLHGIVITYKVVPWRNS